MKPLILLIHTQAHVDALPATAQAIIAAGYDRCWVVISPAIAVDANAASKKFDTEIAAQRAAELAAAARGDYEAAGGYKLAREGKQLDRDKAIADAWKSVPEEDRKTAFRTKLEPLFKAFQNRVSARMVSTQEHYAPAQWISMLNALSGVWPAQFVHGEYMVGWPGAIPVVTKVEKEPETAKQAEKKEVVHVNRAAELTAMKHFSRIALAKKLGIDPTTMGTPALVQAILDREAGIPATPAPELAEY